MYIITTVFIAQLMSVNAGFIVYSAINWYSYLQMKLTSSKKKLGDKEDTIDYLIDDFLITDNDTYNAFNWGYMPLNFNALEGSYSADPYDGLSRIEEMKQVTMAFGDADIRINMDVVYNHHGLTAASNFEQIVPGYYFRKTDSGAFSNGSGTGNETASERAMMQKFIVDSTVFWASEYNISGFRFDLMALHDTDTMNQVADALRDIDPTIMVYGEPWTGGTRDETGP